MEAQGLASMCDQTKGLRNKNMSSKEMLQKTLAIDFPLALSIKDFVLRSISHLGFSKGPLYPESSKNPKNTYRRAMLALPPCHPAMLQLSQETDFDKPSPPGRSLGFKSRPEEIEAALRQEGSTSTAGAETVFSATDAICTEFAATQT